MLNCRDLTRLVSESFERKLKAGERLNLWLHISMCGTCRQFRRLQFRIHEAVRQRDNAIEESVINPADCLSEQSRSRLQQAVLSVLNDDELPSSDGQTG